MMSALYSGATGMKTHDAGLSTVSNNIANVNTIGFKQQYALFQDLMSQSLAPGASWPQNVNQLGLGAQMAANRTVFTEGSFEPGTENTDLAIAGKGYFQVSDGKDSFYTRAGNFRFDKDGWLRTPQDMTVTGMPMVDGKITGVNEPVHINPNDVSPAKATSQISAAFTVPRTATDKSSSETDPFFSLLGKWDGAVTNGVSKDLDPDVTPPLPEGSYAEKQSIKIIDSEGNPRELTLYLDGVDSGIAGSGTTYEYILAADPLDTVGDTGVPTKNSGALMAGTITFSPSGDIVNMTGFVPSGPENAEQPLAQWVPAPMADGKLQFSAAYNGGTAQTMTIDLGVTSETNTMTGAASSAAAVGTDPALLGTMASPVLSEHVSKASDQTTGASSSFMEQDGWVEGSYSNMEVTADGIVRVHYSNAKSADLYTIPLFRFTSDDGLRREGGNLFAATPEAGEVQQGVPGTSNYGTVQGKQLESSNVDMAREMVSLITMQRGFQMNSKTITTADQLLQKAMELKRS